MPLTSAYTKTAPFLGCLKLLLIIFNFIFLVSGVLVLALGIWMKVELYIYMELTTVYYAEAPYVLIGVGCGVIVVGILGCCCILKGKAAPLYAYAGFLVIIFVAELSLGIAASAYRGKLEEGFREGMESAMKMYKDNPTKRKALDGMQATLHCCGSYNYTDWFNVPWEDTIAKNDVPLSCCQDQSSCHNTNLPREPGQSTKDIYEQGCYSQVIAFMQKNFAIMAGVVFGFAFLMLLGALLACCLARNIHKIQYEMVA